MDYWPKWQLRRDAYLGHQGKHILIIPRGECHSSIKLSALVFRTYVKGLVTMLLSPAAAISRKLATLTITPKSK
jgi:hypothetical protein